MIIKDIIDKSDTGIAKGLSTQLISKLNQLTKIQVLTKVDDSLIDTSSNSVNPYLQLVAALYLTTAVKTRNKQMIINSCFRTTIQQHIIYKQFGRGLFGITAAAPPGRSNHEQGLAIDIQSPDGWEPYMSRQNWNRLGQWDKPHYDFPTGRRDIAALQVRSFQLLWNEFNPKDIILVDGVYGHNTAARIDESPVDGW